MKNQLKKAVAVAFICFCTINATYSQASTAQAPTTSNNAKYSKDVSSETAIINALYEVISGESGEARDWDRFKNLFVKDGVLIPTTKSTTGVFGYRTMTPDDYITMFRKRAKA